MSEMHNFDPYAAAGAAGIGAAGLNRSKSTTQPYNAFAGPQTDPYAPPIQALYGESGATTAAPPPAGQNLRYRQRGTSGGNSQDLLAAAGLGASAGVGAGVGAGAAALARGPSQSQAYGQHQQQQQGYGAYPASQQHSQSPPTLSQSTSRPTSMTDEDPYDGIDNSLSPAAPMTNPYSPSSPEQPRHGPHSGGHHDQLSSDDSDGEEKYPDPGYALPGESRMSLRDEEDYAYGGGRRVLKVRRG